MKKPNAEDANVLVSFMKYALRRERDFSGPPAPIVPFADWNYYYTGRKLEWRPSVRFLPTIESISVPEGFVTDLASIPRGLWPLLPKHAIYTYPSVLHDYLYWFQPCEREEADEVLRLAMDELDVPTTTSFTIFNAVRMAGGRAWQNNASRRAAGERRILKKFPTDFKITWTVWQKEPDVFL